jgi:hypothetical protein
MGEIGIEYVIGLRNGSASIAVRCYQGKIAVGEMLASAYKPSAAGERSDIRSISLKIEKIIAYGNELVEMDEGLTAEVILSGEGLSELTDGMVLATSE